MSSSEQGNAAVPGWRFMRRHWAWMLVGLTLLLVVCVRVRLRNMPLERDEGEYAYAGQLILHGAPPYVQAYNMKLPGTYAAYALIMAIFGQSPAGIHLGLMLVNAGSIVLLFLLGRRLLDEITGVVAAVSFALLSLSPSVLGLAGHATQFVVLPALAGVLLLVKSIADCGLRIAEPSNAEPLNAECGIRNAEWSGEAPSNAEPSNSEFGIRNAESGRGHGTRSAVRFQLSAFSFQLFLSGFLLGLAFLMKQHGIFFGLFGLAYLLWARLVQSSRFKVQGSGFASQAVQGSRFAPRPRHPRPPGLSTLNPQPSTAPQPPAAPRLSHFAAAKLAAGSAKTTKETTDHGPQTTDDEQEAPSIPSPPFRNPQSEFRIGPSSAPSTLNSQPSTAPSILGPLLVFATGLVLPYALTCLVLWFSGALHQFVFWTISYAAQYASAIPLVQGPGTLRTTLPVAVGVSSLLWLLPWAGAIVMWWEERLRIADCGLRNNPLRSAERGLRNPEERNPQPASRGPGSGLSTLNPQLSTRQDSAFRIPHSAFFLTALLLCSLGSVSVGLQFRGHYFITLLPVMALLSGVAVSRAIYVLRYDRTIELFLAIPIVLLFVLGVGAALIGNGRPWFGQPPDHVVRNTYQSSLFSEAARAADYLKEHSAPGARVAVLGSEPEIYFLSHRRSATGYLYVYPLMERQPYAQRMQQEMIAEIERARPEFVVYVEDDYSWLRGPDSERKLDDWWKAYSVNLERVASFQIDEGPGEDGEPLDAQAAPRPQAANKRLVVYRRKS